MLIMVNNLCMAMFVQTFVQIGPPVKERIHTDLYRHTTIIIAKKVRCQISMKQSKYRSFLIFLLLKRLYQTTYLHIYISKLWMLDKRRVPTNNTQCLC